MDRRFFVKLSAYTALALTIPLAEGCKPKNNALTQPLLFSHFADKKTIVEAGAAYRKIVPNENSATELSLLLSGNKPTMDADMLRSLLDRQVKQDFISAKTVTVAGWVLSVTEARQCALFSILNS